MRIKVRSGDRISFSAFRGATRRPWIVHPCVVFPKTDSSIERQQDVAFIIVFIEGCGDFVGCFKASLILLSDTTQLSGTFCSQHGVVSGENLLLPFGGSRNYETATPLTSFLVLFYGLIVLRWFAFVFFFLVFCAVFPFVYIYLAHVLCLCNLVLYCNAPDFRLCAEVTQCESTVWRAKNKCCSYISLFYCLII